MCLLRQPPPPTDQPAPNRLLAGLPGCELQQQTPPGGRRGQADGVVPRPQAPPVAGHRGRRPHRHHRGRECICSSAGEKEPSLPFRPPRIDFLPAVVNISAQAGGRTVGRLSIARFVCMPFIWGERAERTFDGGLVNFRVFILALHAAPAPLWAQSD